MIDINDMNNELIVIDGKMQMRHNWRKLACRAAGLTHRQAAKMMGLTMWNLAKYERYLDAELPSDIADMMCNTYEVSTAYIQFGHIQIFADLMADIHGLDEEIRLQRIREWNGTK